MIKISISGSEAAGKTLFTDLLSNYINKSGTVCIKRAFGDSVKAELFDLITYNFGFSPFTKDRNQKDIIRPIFVAYANAKRNISEGTYWIERLKDSLQLMIEDVEVLLVSDLRFATEKYDEINYIQEDGGQVIYLERILNGKVVEPYNEIGEENNKKIKERADFILQWGEGYPEPEQFVKDFADKHILPCLKKS